MRRAAVTTATTLQRVRVVALARLADEPVGRYAPGAPEAAEPTAWSAVALGSAGEESAARRAADWLAERQSAPGSVGATLEDRDPGWATALAILAWGAVDPERYAVPIRRGAEWAFAQEPWTADHVESLGHDTRLEGWSWAPRTHSWLEPTAFFVMALARNGYADHPRVRQGVALLVDRLLPRGGANYGNTFVLGQELLQHLQPTGVVAWALAGESVDDPRWPLTLDYLGRAAYEPTGAASLCYATLGLAANGLRPEALVTPLTAAGERVLAEQSGYKTALLALAASALLDESAPFLRKERA